MFSQDVQHKTWKVINKMLKMMILTFTVDQRSKAKNRGNAATFFFYRFRLQSREGLTQTVQMEIYILFFFKTDDDNYV